MRNTSRLLAPCALALACLALAVRLLAPQGYMVAPAGEGRVLPVVLCTSQGPAAASLDGAGRPAAPGHDEPSSSGDHTPCAFSATGALAFDPPPPLAIRIAHARSMERRPLRPATTPGRGLSAPPPPQTGPPALA